MENQSRGLGIHTVASVRDTLESIFIALIMAFSFRAFVVEAFVIPTGSMAPTLRGAHYQVRCPECGHGDPHNADLSEQYFARPGEPPMLQQMATRGELHDSTIIPLEPRLTQGDRPLICPNCSYPIPPVNLPGNPIERQVKNAWTGNVELRTFPWINNGDRILVLKSLYYFQDPQRWDVIVFKEPMAAADNYIKRLVGLPGDTLEIIGGDLFINGSIARKTFAAQRSMYQNVFDLDEFPMDNGNSSNRPEPWNNPWRPVGANAASWVLNGPRVKLDAAAGRLAFAAGDFYLRNDAGYNFNEDLTSPARHIVGDVHLQTQWLARAAGSALHLTLGPPDHCFEMKLELSGALELSRWDPLTSRLERVAEARTPAFEPGQAVDVAMDNIDHRVVVWVQGKMVLEYLAPWSVQDARRNAESAEVPPRVEVQVQGACELGHLKLARDVYYVQESGSKKELRASTGHPVTLGPDEFFAMGDNSRHSSDSRYWNEVHAGLADLKTPPGVVPRRYMLGKAFFVYWPAGFRPVPKVSFPLVPNAGEMRFIR